MRITPTTVNLPAFASALGAAKGAGFDVDQIAIEISQVFLGTKSTKDIPAEIMQQIADVWVNFGADPLGTSIDVAIGASIPLVMFKGLGLALEMFGLPKSRKFGNIRLKWAL